MILIIGSLFLAVIIVQTYIRWRWSHLIASSHIIEWCYFAETALCTAGAAIDFALGQVAWGSVMVLCAVCYGWLWWWQRRKRRKRRRTLAMLGAKSRARIETLIRRQREAAQPA